MTVNDILIPVRQKLNDMQKLVYSDPELIGWMNRVISDLSIVLSNNKDPEVMSSFTIIDNNIVDRPSNFISYVGVYPIETIVSNGTVKCKALDTNFIGSMDIKYFANKNGVTSLTSTIPFVRQQDISALIDGVFAYASNRDGKAPVAQGG